MVKNLNGLCLKKDKQNGHVPSEDQDVESVSSVGDENKERGNWNHQLDFILSLIGYAVGLGNIWRFPYLCMRNGGGAFLIPYFTFLMLCGMPLYFLELTLGQFSSLSPVSVWKMCPIFRGVGWAMLMVSGLMCIYYNIIITWILYYLFASFTAELPWGSCENEWNTKACVARGVTRNNSSELLSNVTNSSSFTYKAESLTNSTSYWAQMFGLNETSGVNTTNTTLRKASSAEEYFHYSVLEITDGVTNLGGVKWQLLLCLILAWVITFACLCKGVKSVGKVVYVTATFPYVFLTILFIRGVLLPGALEGIKFYIMPDFSRLLHIGVWQEAAIQIFYSLGPAWGGLITMASFNRFNNNLYRDAILIPSVTCGTSFFAGFVIFAVIGYMADLAGTSVDKIVTQGPGLAFIVYPEALTRLPISPLWAILFFLMLLTIGLDSQFATFETVTSCFADEYQFIKKRKTLFTGILCLAEFLLGIVIVTRGGMYVFQILDWYIAVFTLMAIAFIECVTVGWIYGAHRIMDEIEMMIGYRPCYWWIICWRFIIPFLMVAMLIYNVATLKTPSYGDYTYPSWVEGIGWVVALCTFVPVPCVAVWNLYKYQRGSLWQRVKNAIKPDRTWGPGLEKYREDYFIKHNQGPQRGAPMEEMYFIKHSQAPQRGAPMEDMYLRGKGDNRQNGAKV